MIKTLAPKTCAFDCEWVPCAVTARRLLGLPTGSDNRTVDDASAIQVRQSNISRANSSPDR